VQGKAPGYLKVEVPLRHYPTSDSLASCILQLVRKVRFKPGVSSDMRWKTDVEGSSRFGVLAINGLCEKTLST
jgi:hypothetical protein